MFCSQYIKSLSLSAELLLKETSMNKDVFRRDVRKPPTNRDHYTRFG